MKPVLRKVLLSVTFFIPVGGLTQTYSSERPRPQSSTGPETTIRVESDEVLVDVTVTDGHDNPVSGLSRESFQVLEDGKPQNITFFEVHPSSEDAASRKPLPTEPPGVYTNLIDATGSGVVNVLLLDALNTPVTDQAYARAQMINYAKALHPGQPIAVFALTTVLRQLQTFTRDKSSLLAVLNDKAGGPQQTRLGTEGEERVEMARELDKLGSGGVHQEAIEGVRHFYQDRISVHRDQRVKMTLEAFQQLSRYLASIPGKKNLLWFSATFPFVPFPETVSSAGVQDGMRLGAPDYSDEIRKTADLMAANRIAVFPIDVRGIMLPPSFDVSRSHRGNIGIGSPFGSSQEIQEFENETGGEHDTMDALAKETGGRAIYNTNDLQGAIDQVIQTGSFYYTLRYRPTNTTLDNQLRHIDVKLDRKNVRLAFRHEYYASRRRGTADNESYNPVDFFHAAMQKGYPESSQIVLKVRVNSPALLAENVGLGAEEAGKSNSSTSRYGIDIAADIAAMQTQRTSDDGRRGELVIGVVAYGEHGELLNSETKHGELAFLPSDYAHVLQNGFLFHLDIDVPHGASCIRIGVFDPLSGNIGTVEIPYPPAGELLSPKIN